MTHHFQNFHLVVISNVEGIKNFFQMSRISTCVRIASQDLFFCDLEFLDFWFPLNFIDLENRKLHTQSSRFSLFYFFNEGVHA